MKKIVLGLVAIVIVALIAMPYFVGKFAETETRKQVEIIENLDPSAQLKLKSFERSYGSSQARFVYSYKETNVVDFTLEFLCDYNHGIIGVDYRCEIENQAYQDWVAEHLDEKAPFDILGEVNVFGKNDSVVKIHGFSIKDTGNLAAIELSSGEFQFKSDTQFSYVDVEGGITSLRLLDKKGEEVKLNNFSLQTTMTPDAHPNIYWGDMLFKIDEISVDSVSIKDMVFRSETKKSSNNESRMNIHQDFTIAALDGKIQGTDLSKLSNLSFKFNIGEMDIKAYSDFVGQLMSLQYTDDGKMPIDFQAEMISRLNQLLTQDFTLTPSVSIEVDGEKTFFDMEIGLVKTTNLMGLATYMQQLNHIGDVVSIKVDSKIDTSFIQMLPANAQGVKLPLYQVEDDGSLALHLLIDAQKTRLNGQDTTVEALLPMLGR